MRCAKLVGGLEDVAVAQGPRPEFERGGPRDPPFLLGRRQQSGRLADRGRRHAQGAALDGQEPEGRTCPSVSKRVVGGHVRGHDNRGPVENVC